MTIRISGEFGPGPNPTWVEITEENITEVLKDWHEARRYFSSGPNEPKPEESTGTAPTPVASVKDPYAETAKKVRPRRNLRAEAAAPPPTNLPPEPAPAPAPVDVAEVKPAGKVPTPQEIRDAVVAWSSKNGGMAKVMEIIQRYGVRQVVQLNDEQKIAFHREMIEGAK